MAESSDMTAVRVSAENWETINSARDPGETMDDALSRLLAASGDDTE